MTEQLISVLSVNEPGGIANHIAHNVNLNYDEKQSLLEELYPSRRLVRLGKILRRELNILQLERELADATQEQMNQNQREYYLREEMKIIQAELGEDGQTDDIGEYRRKISALAAPDEIKEKLNKELSRLMKQPFGSSEAAVLRGYLDTCLELPWGKKTTETIDLEKARKLLDDEHFGLEKVKDRVIEYLAVKKLSPNIKGGLICLVGPPGTGKTSIAMSIAKAVNRKLVRVSLGGVHDEAEIRGHRKTYIGSMPGRIINGIIQAKSCNPLMVLDEIYLTGEDTVVPLDDLFADEKYGLGGSEVRFDSPTQAEITHQFLSECAINGHYYAIPYMRSTEACYVNKTYVEKLGYTLPDVLTWDFVWEVSEAAMAKDSAGNFLLNGQKVLIPFIDKSTDNMMIQMLKQQGAGYSTSSGEVQLFNDTTGEILTTIAEHAASGAFNTFKLAGYPANFLNAGQCIFAIDSTAGATWMGADAPLIDIAEEKLIPFELAVLPVPQFDPEQPRMISQGPSVCVFNKSDSQEVLASWLFALYLLTDDVQIAYSQTEGYIPVTSKAQESPAYQDYLSRCGEDNDTHYRAKIEAAQLLMRYTDCTFVTPVFNGSASLRSAAGQLIEDVNKSVRRHQTVNAKYLSSLYSDVSSLYRLDQIQVSASGLGPLPGVSKALLIGLAVCWVGMGTYVLSEKLKKRRKKD